MCLGHRPRGAPDPQRGRRRRATCWCCSARAPAATASAARRCWPAPSSTRTTTPSARPCRSATRSRRRGCSSAASSCSTAGVLRSLQDLGAAGLSSSSSEMASKGEVGLDLDVSKVPLREADMEPFEIMISESQERMLCVVEPRAAAPSCAEVCERWEVRATAIGEVTDTRRLRVLDGDERGGRHAGRGAGGRLPALRPRARASPPSRSTRRRRARSTPTTRARALLALLGSPNLASRAPLFEQYDCDRRLAHRAPPGGRPTPPCCSSRTTAAAARSPSRSTATAAAWPATPTRARSRRCSSARANLACVGAEPLGLTNCLNFGNPEKPHVAWQLDRGGGGPGATPAARSTCRWSAATSRSTTRRARGPDLPDAGRRHGRAPARPRARAGPSASRARATRSRSCGPFAPRLEGSELAKLRGRRCPTGCRRSTCGARRPATRRCARPCARAGWPRPRRGRGRLAVALAESCLAGGLGARSTSRVAAEHDRRAPLRRGPGRRRRGRPGRSRRARPGRRHAGRDGWRSPADRGLGGPSRSGSLRDRFEGAIPAAYA